ncbi:MAG: alpha/beta hydrolase [Promethearchaeota archaeon]
MNNRRKYLTLGLLSILFLCSLGAFLIFPTDIKRTYNQSTLTSDGVKIVYDVFEPKSEESSMKTAVILGHGIMVNKNFMRTIALDLAGQGIVSIALDFRGHGRSGGSIKEGDLTTDILAVKEVLATRGDINMTNLGYVGYSMGGGAGFRLLNNDSDFRAMVSLAAGGRAQYSTPNLLILHGIWDELNIYSNVLEYMENKTGIHEDNIETDRIYGSFTNGTALQVSLAKTDHLFAPYSYKNVREIRFWFLQALNGESDPDSSFVNYFLLILSVLIATVSGLYIFLLGTDVILSKIIHNSKSTEYISDESNPEKPSYLEKIIQDQSKLSKIIRMYWVFVLPLSIPCMVFALPLLPVPMFYMVLFSALLMGPSMATLFYQIYILKKNKIKLKEFYLKIFKSTKIQNLLLGLIFGGILYSLLCLTIGYIFGIVPSSTKWGWAVLFFAIIIIIQFNFAQFFQPVVIRGIGYDTKKQRFQGQLTIFAMYFGSITFLVLLSLLIFQSWFNIQFIFPFIPLILIVNVISGKFYQKTQDLILPVVTNSVYLTLILITLANI